MFFLHLERDYSSDQFASSDESPDEVSDKVPAYLGLEPKSPVKSYLSADKTGVQNPFESTPIYGVSLFSCL